jgi:hypothetical protein
MRAEHSTVGGEGQAIPAEHETITTCLPKLADGFDLPDRTEGWKSWLLVQAFLMYFDFSAAECAMRDTGHASGSK